MSSALVVRWGNLNEAGTNYYLELGNEDRTQEIRLSSIQNKVGSYAIPSDVLALLTNGQRSDVLIKMRSVTSGKIDPKFNGGSIQIIESVYKQVTLGLEDSSMEEDKKYEAYVPM